MNRTRNLLPGSHTSDSTTRPMTQLRPARNFTIIIMFLLGSTLCDRLQLKTIIPSIRPGTPSWAYYYLAKNKQKVKRLTKPNKFYNLDINSSSEETSTSCNSRSRYSASLRLKIRRVKKLSRQGTAEVHVPQLFGTGSHSRQPPAEDLPSTSSTPSTVRCEYPLDERDTQSTWTSLQQWRYRKNDEAQGLSLLSLKDFDRGEKNLHELFGAREELTKMDSLPASLKSSKWASPTWVEELSPSTDQEVESFQETDNKEDQESVIASKSCSYEELKADSFIATTNSAAFSCLGDEQLPIRFAIPVRPRSLLRRILASCVRAFETCFTRVSTWSRSLCRTESYT
ncbi:hypothetical protein SFRURICE_005348, partial [Spodoptera frugiperda]